MTVTDRIDEYFALMEAHPDFFIESDIYPIETDRENLKNFAEKNGVPVGVAYKSKYTLLVVDLIKKPDGGHFTYERILPVSDGKGVVCVPVYNGKLVLIWQYRHSMRDFQLAFPRGFGENGLTSEENAEKELLEEIGAKTEKIRKLGETVADSGLSGASVDVMLCEISHYEPQTGHEGIEKTVVLSLSEIEEKIKTGEINDGFTLSACTLCREFKELI